MTLANIRGRYFVLVYVSQLWIVESDRRLLMSIKPLWPLCTQAETCMNHCTLISKTSLKRLVGFLLTPIKTVLILPKNSNHLKFQSSAANASRFTWFWFQEMSKNGEKKTFSVPSMICAQCSYFNGKPQKKLRKKKKNHFYWQGVLLVCFWFIRFWFLYTAQTWKKVEMSKKQNKIK